MSESFVIEAEPRTDLGKGASRRLRREGKVPGVIYGTGKEPASISLQHNELAHQLENEAFFFPHPDRQGWQEGRTGDPQGPAASPKQTGDNACGSAACQCQGENPCAGAVALPE